MQSIMRYMLCVSISAAIPTVVAQAQHYSVQDLGVLPGYERSFATNINEAGQVAGFSENADFGATVSGPFHRSFFIWLPGASDRRPAGLNDFGNALIGGPMHVGVSRNAHRTWVGTLMQGSWMDPADAFIWNAQTGVQLLEHLPGATQATAYGVNDEDVVVGAANRVLAGDGGGGNGESGGVVTRPFRWAETDGTQELSLPDGVVHARAHGINNRGVIVGGSLTQAQGSFLHFATGKIGTFERALIWRGDQVFDLNDFMGPESGWTVINAAGINSRGQIAATARDEAGNIRAVLLTPEFRDFNLDGSVDPLDIIDFQQSLEASEPVSDLDGDGVPDGLDLDVLLDGIAGQPVPGEEIPVEDPDVGISQLLIIWNLLDEIEAMLDEEYLAWLNCGPVCWNDWHARFNDDCFGCSGNNPRNPARPNGAPGWPGTAPLNPYAPNGGPGGDGGPGGHGGDGGSAVPGTDGNGGDGGNGGPSDGFGPGGNGGNGGNGSGSGIGGKGGRGGYGWPGSPTNNNGSGNGGTGGSGGKGGSGAALGTPTM